MLVVFKGVKQEYVYIADTEYDHMKIIESAGYVFQRVDDRNDIYQLAFSFDHYIKKARIHRYVQQYTGITPEFLAEEGLENEDFVKLYDEMFKDIDPEDTIFVSHGTQADRKVLKNSGVAFHPSHSYCTYKNAKRILKRENKVSLSDVAEEAGFMLKNKHSADADAWATVVAFSFLRKLEWQES